MKYLVHYVDNCEPKQKKFKSLSGAQKFVKKFQKENPTNNEGFWIDFIIEYNKIHYLDRYWTEK